MQDAAEKTIKAASDGSADGSVDAWGTAGKASDGPLHSIRVLDLTHARSGPACVRQLTDWGARAIKVEMPGLADDDIAAGHRHSSDFQNLHRNKRSLSINLKDPEALDIFKRLVKDADVVVENFRPGVKFKLGIDYETLKAINPRLVFASISGFGQEGPYKDRPGVDQVIQGMGGLMSVTGLPGQGPVRVGIPIADLTAGIFLAYGILLALYDRERTGQGQWVKTSLLAALIQMMDLQSTRWLVDGEVPPQAGNNHPTGTPMGVFAASNGHINIAAASQKMFGRFCEAVGKTEWLADPNYNTPKKRRANRDKINALVEEVTRTKDMAYWVALLNKVGVPCGPIYSVDQMFADEQVKLIDIPKTVHHPVVGDLRLVGQAVELVRTPSRVRTAAPEAGAQTSEILSSLGLDAAKISELRKRGAA